MATLIAPTLVVHAGDTLRARLDDRLPASSTLLRSTHDYLNYQNSSNLHAHCMHVDPKEVRPSVFGDYVVDHWNEGVKPGASRQHEVTLPTADTPGCNWYHPHLHSSSLTQVASGMFGALLCRHPDDRLAPESTAALPHAGGRRLVHDASCAGGVTQDLAADFRSRPSPSRSMLAQHAMTWSSHGSSSVCERLTSRAHCSRATN